ncbi:hypothetical protein ZWY2020_000534 [Hordeum vulgare]|nr:hypothetical protein ZWY2020_000534 [Hordeum vulgare]
MAASSGRPLPSLSPATKSHASPVPNLLPCLIPFAPWSGRPPERLCKAEGSEVLGPPTALLHQGRWAAVTHGWVWWSWEKQATGVDRYAEGSAREAEDGRRRLGPSSSRYYLLEEAP